MPSTPEAHRLATVSRVARQSISPSLPMASKTAPQMPSGALAGRAARWSGKALLPAAFVRPVCRLDDGDDLAAVVARHGNRRVVQDCVAHVRPLADDGVVHPV